MSGCSPTRFRGLTRFAFGGDVIETKRVDRHYFWAIQRCRTAGGLALVDAAGVDRVHLVGHDWGGGVAWMVAATRPDRLHTLTVVSSPHPRAVVGAMLTSRQLLQAWHVGFFQLPWLPEAAIRSRGGRFAVALLKHSGPWR